MSVYVDQLKLLTSQDLPINYWNLLNGTSNFNKIANNTYEGQVSSDVVTPSGNNSFAKSRAWNCPAIKGHIIKDNIYTFSQLVYLSTSNAGNVRVYADDNFTILKNKVLQLSEVPLNTWTKAYYVFKANVTADITFGLSPSKDGKYYVGDYMLNKGSIPLDWNYSLADIRTKMGGWQPPKPLISVLYTTLSESEVA